MNQRLTNTIQYIAIVLVGLFFCTLIFFFLDDARFDNRLYRNVSIAGIDVSLMTKKEFFKVAQELQQNIEDKKIFIEYNQELLEVSSEDMGLQISPDELWKQLYEYGHIYRGIDNFPVWFNSFSDTYEVETQLFADNERITQQMQVWKEFVPSTDPYNGDLTIEDDKAVVDEPVAGSRLDTQKLAEQVIDALINDSKEGTVINVPLIRIEPERSLQDLVDAQYKVNSLISSPLTLRNRNYDERTLTLRPSDIAGMTTISFDDEDITQVVIELDEDILAQNLSPLYPREASFIVNEDEQVSVRSSQDGFIIDIPKTVENILDTVGKNRHEATYEVIEYQEPTFTTEDAQALNINHLVSRFTTYHSCCQDRVKNIHLVADLLDETYLLPGETMNLNDFLGERTQERGFKNAGTIIEGKLEESVGGGISQFVTTFHNAVYWGGYRVVDHKPHSIYFSRYPLGIEATINWPYVDYTFQNDTDTGLYIDTSYTDESITVSFYGSNDGRQAIGDQKGGRTNIDVTGTGENSRVVISHVSQKYNFHEPLVEYVADTSVPRGTEVLEQVGDQRFSVVVTRTVKQGDEVIRQDTWPVHYRQDNTIIRKHPCDFYDKEFDYSQC